MKYNEDFKAFYEGYLEFSIRIARRFLKDESLAQDISDETFLHLYEIFSTIDLTDERKIRALVSIATHNKVKDYLRKSHIRAEVALVTERNSEEITENTYDDRLIVESPEEILLRAEQNEKRKKILRELRKQNPENFDILMKVKYYEVSPKDVAKEYGITTNALNNRLLRTRLWLQKQFLK